jgi:hypothetical protein
VSRGGAVEQDRLDVDDVLFTNRDRRDPPERCLRRACARMRRPPSLILAVRRGGTGCWSAVICEPASGPSTVAGCPVPLPLGTLVRVAGRRWTIEERFQTGKGLVGLDQHQVRCWRSWYRWTTLAMLAHAFLIVAALTERTRHPSPSGLIGLTCNELQHLFAALVARPTGDLNHRVRWSVWRRQARAGAATTADKPPSEP